MERMMECHKLAFSQLSLLTADATPFLIGDEKAIKIEIKKIQRQIQNIINETFNDVASAIERIPKVSQMLSEFFNFFHIYLSNNACKSRGLLFAGILQDFLCKQNDARPINYNIIYHLMANYGLIMCGCLRLYQYNAGLKGQEPVIVPVTTALSQLRNPAYRFSKSSVRDCIENVSTSLPDLILARKLLVQSLTFRQKFSMVCPTKASLQTKQQKTEHEKFESNLIEIIRALDGVIKTRPESVVLAK